MKLDIDSRIPFSRELVFETYRDHMGDLVPYLPNVKSIEVVERSEADGKVSLKNLWWAKSEIPKVAQSVLKPEMLSWYDWATWDQATFSNVWRLELRAMKDVVECHGANRFVADGPNACVLELRGDLTLHLKNVPGVPRLLAGTIAPTIEKFVVAMLKPNLTEVARGIESYLAKRK